MKISRSIHVAANGIILFFLLENSKTNASKARARHTGFLIKWQFVITTYIGAGEATLFIWLCGSFLPGDVSSSLNI